MKQALLLVAHGSRRTASNKEVEKVTEQLRKDYRSVFSLYDTAFLELASPSIEEGIINCINNGAEQIRVLPYFLAAGQHVAVDIPQIIEKMRKAYPNTIIQMTPHLGASPMVEEALMAVAVDDGIDKLA